MKSYLVELENRKEKETEVSNYSDVQSSKEWFDYSILSTDERRK